MFEHVAEPKGTTRELVTGLLLIFLCVGGCGIYAALWSAEISSARASDREQILLDNQRGKIKEHKEMNEIMAARKTMRDAFKEDEGFKLGYLANIAMLLYDELGLGKEKRDDVSEKILQRIFY